jgi:hypothetical protein
MRLFLDEGLPMRLLISDFRFWIEKQHGGARSEGRDSLSGYVDQLLAAFPQAVSPTETPQARAQNLVEPLSDRELKSRASWPPANRIRKSPLNW